MSERNLPFETYSGNVKVEFTDEPLTPFGGLVPFAAFLKKTGIIEHLAESCPVVRTSPNALDVRDIILSYMLTALFDGKHFSDVNYFRNDPVVPEMFDISRIAGDDTIRRFFKSLDTADAQAWIDNATKKMFNVLPDKYILDWDSTVITRYGNQELSEVGYNPTKRGRKSHHPLLAIVADTRLCMHYTLRAGNAVSNSDSVECMEQALALVDKDNQPWLNRGDIGFGTDEIMKWHESSPDRPDYLFKLKKSSNIKKAIASIKDEDWQGCNSYGILQTAERQIQLSGWDAPRRVVFSRRLVCKTPAFSEGNLWDIYEHKYDAYVTSLPFEHTNSWQLIDLYKERADCENMFDEAKNQWGFGNFCAKSKTVTEVAARLLLVTYNLWTLFTRAMNPQKHTEAKTTRRTYLLIAAKRVRSARETLMKMATGKRQKEKLTEGYKNIHLWLNSTAPQLDLTSQIMPP
jgi:hypothetical protein